MNLRSRVTYVLSFCSDRDVTPPQDRHSVEVVVKMEMEDGEEPAVQDLAAVPAPTLVGPFFTDIKSSQSADDQSTADAPSGDARQLQTLLAQLGYGVGSVDGWFGPITGEAVKTLQTTWGLAADAVAGPITKGFLLQRMNDGMKHVLPEGHVRAPLVPLQPAHLPNTGLGNSLDTWTGRPI